MTQTPESERIGHNPPSVDLWVAMEVQPLRTDFVDSGRAQFIGLVLNWGLYGLLISQTFTYCATFPHDTRINKTIAYSVFSLETLQTALLTYDTYCAFVLNPGDVEFLERTRFIWFTVPVLCGIVGWIAAIFYANRIYRISRSRKVSGIIVLLSFVQLAAGIMVGIETHWAQNFVAFRQVNGQPPPVIWSVSMTLCDTMIAVAMTYYLVRLRREFHQSSPILRKLMTLTLETGTATALAAISGGVLYTAWPDSQSFLTPGFALGKLYANSLLRVLNSRNRTEHTGDIVTLPISFEIFDHDTGASPAQTDTERRRPVILREGV